ncbi:DHHW family protein [uncultured Ruminococcus sp.]|uniref:DHHW family protein n=1 Tax=uncultured Ruminococcus sp. TaxID=165186 RepID=UPI00261F353E|nr:DHHW family protein [uncultured Ruminococcus sp.]
MNKDNKNVLTVKDKNRPADENKNAARPGPAISIEASDRDKTAIDIPIKAKKLRRQRRKTALNSIALANILLMGAVFAGGFVYVTLLPHETRADDENRMLATFPKFTPKNYISGEFTGGIADYFDDTVHDRAHIKQFIADNISPLKGRKYGDGEDGAELYGNGFVPKSTAAVTTAAKTTKTADSAVTTTETAAVPETTAPPEEVPEQGELTNNILIVNKRGITLYGGAWGTEKEYASFVNQYKEALGSKNVYSMVLPTSSSFYLPENYANLAYSEKADFDSIEESLSGVIPVDAYNILNAHKDEPIYSRTDHHWQPLGAYYAAEEFALMAGVPFADISEYEKVTLPGYVGTLYMYTQSATLLNNPEDFVYYKPKTPVTVTQYNTRFENPVAANLLLDPSSMPNSGYYMVFGSDERIVHVNTECKNGRNLVIFKDSYGNALLPMLTSSFENIYLCDIRYFDLNAIDFIDSVEATDVLFAMCSFSAVGGNRSCIRNNLTK